MAIERIKQAHLWERDEHDWYVEPIECSRALFDAIEFDGTVWDPACGLGRIVKSARDYGLDAIGTDLVSRAEICMSEKDFLKDDMIKGFSHIVSNPPFRFAEEFVRHSLKIVPDNGMVAMLLPLVWLSGFSQKRYWLPASPLYKFFPISPRPSMPPGRVIETGIKPGNGTKDFAWFVWKNGYQGDAKVVFMNTKDYISGM